MKSKLMEKKEVILILFDLATDVLAIMLDRATINKVVNGLSSHLVNKGVSILQYADDTILHL